MNPFDSPTQVADRATRSRAVQLARERRVRLPTFAEIADPSRAPPSAREALAGIDPDAPHAANLYRVNWFNAIDRRGVASVPVHVEVPSALTGVPARIVVVLGALFPMIAAHKVLAAYACLAPRLVSGRFDPDAPARGLAVDRQLLSRRRRDLAHPRVPRRRGAAGRHERRALRVARALGREPRGHRSHAGHRVATSRRSTTAARELARDPANDIVNQFSEFGNYLGHWRCTGPALGARVRGARPDAPGRRASPASSRRAAPRERWARATTSRRSTARGSRRSRRSNARRC